jgi:hypothetical protein
MTGNVQLYLSEARLACFGWRAVSRIRPPGQQLRGSNHFIALMPRLAANRRGIAAPHVLFLRTPEGVVHSDGG